MKAIKTRYPISTKKGISSPQQEKFMPEWEFQIERDTTALLIIDMQDEFMHADGYFGKKAKLLGYDFKFRKTVIPCIERLAKAMREMGVPVIYSQTMWEQDYSDVGLPLRVSPEAKDYGYLVKNTGGAQILDELKPQKGDYVVEAKCFSKFPYTPLGLILRNKGIKTLIFTGVGSSICVESTLREAVDMGFQCIMTSDGTKGKDRPTHEATLHRIGRYFGMVKTCEEVIKLL